MTTQADAFDSQLPRVEDLTSELTSILAAMSIDARVCSLNQIRRKLHEVSPMAGEPVDFVEWVPIDTVYANDYNPNSVAPPEMELLRTSIVSDGYTQPIVTFPEDEGAQVVDGFHRSRVARECPEVTKRLHGYLPVVSINTSQSGKADRIASTIRHNRARGKHQVGVMSEIVLDLKKRNWSDKKIGKELGMDPDEVLRLGQISGLAEMFEDWEFSKSWEVRPSEETEA